MEYTVVIGLEVHVQLLTNSKLFCACANRFNPDQPNSQTCPVCLGLPGSLPVMNREAFQLALKTALAINCEIAPFTKWDRKQYYYPDLPKAYQISQYDLPFSHDGWLEFRSDPDQDAVTRVGIIRAHLEEDAGKNLHDESGHGRDSQVDLNRTGTPLLEIVSEPDLRSAVDARRFLEELRLLLTYLGVSDCNMQEGSLRCDANVNLHVPGDNGEIVATPIVEIKNMNSFRNVEAALEYESKRQVGEWKKTGEQLGDVPKQTRGWDASRCVTFAQRGKEDASDYRYLPDPDLVPVTVVPDAIAAIRNAMCELPIARRERLLAAYALSAYDAGVITDQGRLFADYFEAVANQCGDGKLAANWCTQEVLRQINERQIGIDTFEVPPETLGTILSLVAKRKIATSGAREVFAAFLDDIAAGRSVQPERVAEIVEERQLMVVEDTGELEQVVRAVIQRNENVAADVRSGKIAAVGPLIGQVRAEVKGADAKVVRQMLIDFLTAN